MRNQQLIAVGLLAVCCLAGYLASAGNASTTAPSVPAKVLRAQRIELVDQKGRVRIVLDASTDDDFTKVLLSNPDGNEIRMTVSEQSSSITMSDTKTTNRVMIESATGGDTNVSVQDRQGRPAAAITVGRDGRAAVLEIKPGDRGKPLD